MQVPSKSPIHHWVTPYEHKYDCDLHYQEMMLGNARLYVHDFPDENSATKKCIMQNAQLCWWFNQPHVRVVSSIELQNTQELRSMAEEIAAPKSNSPHQNQKQYDFEASFKRISLKKYQRQHMNGGEVVQGKLDVDVARALDFTISFFFNAWEEDLVQETANNLC